MEWIRVEDELPKDNERVLVLLESSFKFPHSRELTKRIYEGSFSIKMGWDIPQNPDGNMAVKIAWMPRPKDI